jgi:hypothetical protein
VSIIEKKEGMETKGWGGIDNDTELRCHHGKCPRHMLCRDGENTGRRYLACPERVRFDTSLCSLVTVILCLLVSHCIFACGC